MDMSIAYQEGVQEQDRMKTSAVRICEIPGSAWSNVGWEEPTEYFSDCLTFLHSKGLK